MRKVFCTLCALCIICTLTACSFAPNEVPEKVQTSIKTTESTTISTAIDKNIDSVAEYLGYTDGEETYYATIGAIAGKEYDGGNFELYEFDENSEEYKTTINGGGLVKASAYKDGIVLIFPNDEYNQELVDKFNNIEFK